MSGVLRRQPQIDFRTALEAGLRGLDDKSVLALAAKEGRILVTHDRRTMPRHFAEFNDTAASPGLIIVAQKADVLSVIEDLILIWAASESEEWVNSVCTIPF